MGSWCKEFEEVTRAGSNSTANGTNATPVEPPEPVELMNASNATWALVSGASDSPRVAESQAPNATGAKAAPALNEKLVAQFNASLGAAEPRVKAVAKKDVTHKSK